MVGPSLWIKHTFSQKMFTPTVFDIRRLLELCVTLYGKVIWFVLFLCLIVTKPFLGWNCANYTEDWDPGRPFISDQPAATPFQTDWTWFKSCCLIGAVELFMPFAVKWIILSDMNRRWSSTSIWPISHINNSKEMSKRISDVMRTSSTNENYHLRDWRYKYGTK